VARIPFNRVALAGRELDYIRDAIGALHISGDGAFTKRSEAVLQDLFGARVLLTTSCTHALEMAALLLDIAPGDDVVGPSFTFVSTFNAFVLRGARPVFADITPDTLNLDPASLERAITPRTRAIVAMHYGGVACDMDAIGAIAAARGIPIVEDNAHGLFGAWRGRALGTFGVMATLSFHETKNITCGEGGGLVLNDPALVDRAEIVREKGTDRSRFFRGQVDKYSWRDVGSSYVPSDILAAYLLAQLEQRDEIQRRRRARWHAYRDGLAGWAAAAGVSLPTIPDGADHPAHLFYLLLPTAAARDAMLAHLRGEAIDGLFHYLPLHLSDMGRRFGGSPGACPVTESVSSRLIRLPLSGGLTDEEQQRTIDAVVRFDGVPEKKTGPA
jgi:dTDP-4-amino-4,6-dideoxygalactose transaminase